MLELIAKALKDYSETGTAVILGSEEVDCGEVAMYVTDVLIGLKCSFEHWLNDVENSYFIIDCGNKVELPNHFLDLKGRD